MARMTVVTSRVAAPSRRVPVWRIGLGKRSLPLVCGQSIRCGSHPGNDLVLDDAAASRVHLELVGEAGGVRVRDLGSTNGTHVAGVQVVEAVVGDGARIVVGRQTLTVAAPQAHERTEGRFGALVGDSPAMRGLFDRLRQVAQADTTVLVQAESGCGKELLARSLHQASPRRAGPFVVLDCAAVSPTLLESALFGHEKGAFTGATARRAGCFEEAHGGTLFIDEVGELPLEQQPRLLRALESRTVRRLGGSADLPVDVRVVAATHRELAREVNRGGFREDLYYRLAVVQLRIPPLRERLDDLPVLVEQLVLDQVGKDRARAHALLSGMDEAQWARLRSHRWRGNVRELRNAVERSLALAQPQLAPPSGLSAPAEEPGVALDVPFLEQKQAVLDRFEARYLAAVLERHGGNFSRAAAHAGIDRMYFKRLLRKHGLAEPGAR